MANQVKNANVFAVLFIAIVTLVAVLGIIFGPNLNSCLKQQDGLQNGLIKCINKEVFNNKIYIKPQNETPVLKQQEPQETTKKIPELTKVAPIKIESVEAEPVEAEPVEAEPVDLAPVSAKAFIAIENPSVLDVAEVLAIELTKPEEEIKTEELVISNFKRPVVKDEIKPVTPIVIPVIEAKKQKTIIKNIINQKNIEQSKSPQQEEVQFREAEDKNSNLEISEYIIDDDDISFIKNSDELFKILPKNLSVQPSLRQPISIDEIIIDKNNNYLSGKGESGLVAQLFVNDKIVDKSDVNNGIWKVYFDENFLKSPNKQVRIDFFKTKTIDVFASVNIDFFDIDNKQKEPYFNYEEDVSSARLVVKKGDNLWNLAKKYYGSGYRYYVIYNANNDEINNPHWIYPKQIFDLPY